jgi:hypothetical protein
LAPSANDPRDHWPVLITNHLLTTPFIALAMLIVWTYRQERKVVR